MSLEDNIVALTKAIEANTAALLAGGGAAAPAATTAPAAETTGKGKGGKTSKTTEPTVTREQMVAALNDVKEKKGVAAAKAIIKDVGGADKMADIPEGKIAEVHKAATDALKEEEEAM